MPWQVARLIKRVTTRDLRLGVRCGQATRGVGMWMPLCADNVDFALGVKPDSPKMRDDPGITRDRTMDDSAL
jgi:hypothetical protein